MSTNDHNLNIFKILFIIKGILTLIASLFPLGFIFMSAIIISKESPDTQDAQIGSAIVYVVCITLFLFFLVLGILTILTGKYLGEKKKYDFVFVMSILSCLTGILGIILGIFTILELNKPAVKRLFGKTV